MNANARRPEAQIDSSYEDRERHPVGGRRPLSPTKDMIPVIEERSPAYREKFTSSSASIVYFKKAHDIRKTAMLLRSINSLSQSSSPIRVLGAYAAVALIVPGGSLIAFFLWASRHRRWPTVRAWRALVAVAALGTGLMFPG